MNRPTKSGFDAAAAADDTPIIAHHVGKALAGLPDNASRYDKAAALNAYVHLTLKRTDGSIAQTADEVLVAGEAVCGGMSLVLIKMLDHIGLRAEYAFTHGGLAAHSMVEVIFTEIVHGLFDPYHGVAFYSSSRGRPLSILEMDDFVHADPAPVFYVRRSLDRSLPLSRENAYSETDEDGRRDFAFPGLFTDADGVGLGNSGFVSFIHAELAPGTTLGDATWSPGKPEATRPWSALSQLQRPNGGYVSWAYLLGQTSLGYRIGHIYTIRDLVPGSRYELVLKIANAYVNANSITPDPAITIHPALPAGRSGFVSLDVRGFREGEDYYPQTARKTFTAETAEMTFIAAATGDIVLQSIALLQK
ncbi:hypothetical protein [Hyphobacterium marinum]|uniref:Malectin domain-containing protein n=1 Tax=Hyphobacterium marinum TaxID=3116574 RepID=A0ABU7LYV7_9PROT|nr:hypothetical protein [Hyphobacterium sp. Y6023]MEE2566462.1 hypothetical protein [Hyphobacterium sp. Y6023]